jgi:Domain of unknown function (DUF397)
MTQSLEAVPDRGMPLEEITALSWRKSTRSIGNGQCVEAARLTDGRLVMRDSTDTSGPVIFYTREEWRALVKEIKDGKFDF